MNIGDKVKLTYKTTGELPSTVDTDTVYFLDQPQNIYVADRLVADVSTVTNDYSDQTNIPSINGTPITGDLDLADIDMHTTVWQVTEDAVYLCTYVIDINQTYTEEKHNGESALAISFTPTKSGYIFLGWREDNEANVEVLTSKVVDGANITLYAVFGQARTVRLYNNSTSYVVDTCYQAYNNGSIQNPLYTPPAIETVAGWTARGWSRSTAADGALIPIPYVISTTSTISLYSSYYNAITITFDGNGATSGSVDPTSGTRYRSYNGTIIEASIIMPRNQYSYGDKIFLCWGNSATSPTAKYLEEFAYTMSNSQILYAKWGDVSSGTKLLENGEIVHAKGSRYTTYNKMGSVVVHAGGGSDFYGLEGTTDSSTSSQSYLITYAQLNNITLPEGTVFIVEYISSQVPYDTSATLQHCGVSLQYGGSRVSEIITTDLSVTSSQSCKLTLKRQSTAEGAPSAPYRIQINYGGGLGHSYSVVTTGLYNVSYITP